MRSKALLLALVLSLAAALAVAAGADEGRHNEDRFGYSVGLWGDLPYNDVQALTGVPNLIADMNSQNLRFSINDGDLKAGNGIGTLVGAVFTETSAWPSTCKDALYDQSLSTFFNKLQAPAAFTPGDNDWTDCDRPKNGGYNSRNRLDLERTKFFATPFSFGQRKLKQDVQALSDASYCLNEAGVPVACVENRRWNVEGVTYATVNIQGSCNNLCDQSPDPAEFAARNAADIAWLQETFAKAKADGSAGIMIVGQADPGFDRTDVTRTSPRDPLTLAELDPTDPTLQRAQNPALDGFVSFLTALRSLTIDFKRPVVYVHGDSHYFRVDKPLLAANGQRVENFTRVETYGDNAANGTNDVHWVKVLVDSRSRDVFAFQAQVVPGNRTAVPAP